MPSYHFDPQDHLEQLVPLFKQWETQEVADPKTLNQLLNAHTKPDGALFSKDQLQKAYLELAGSHGLLPRNPRIVAQLKMKPIRTMSGVTPVTVLTKPFPCPGTCIFCPNDIRMPKSYLSNEPGAQRAERNYFDPYLQTYNRLQALKNIGHPVEKVEIIVLGGTWSYYPEEYQIWFIKECFRALNEFGHQDDRIQIENRYQQMEATYQAMNRHAPTNQPSANKESLATAEIQGDMLTKSYNQVISEKYVAPERLAGFHEYQSATWPELEFEHHRNELAQCRSVGLVVETRPDNISEEEVIRIRRLGCTKTQIGFQSLNDQVLRKNKRGHTVAATRRAVSLLRQAGFKIHAHWMANLYGSSVEKDKQDYLQLFSDPDFMPDELKIYPCSLINSAELMQYYRRGLWQPYAYEELLDILTFCLQNTAEYCRLTRVIRDIPSPDIVEGNKLTNFRQIAENALAKAGHQSKDIRAREIRNKNFDPETLQLNEVWYSTSVSREAFLQYVLPNHQIVAFLRLSIPTVNNFMQELTDSAIIREVHVYGQSLELASKDRDQAQHLGLGSKLIEHAKKLAKQHNSARLAVISAVGTREYYRKRGFVDQQLYQIADLS